jgi:hypothetical protein
MPSETNRICCVSRLVLLLVSLAFLFSGAINAQSTRIRGQIVDHNSKEPIPFVTVLIKGTNVGTITDNKGNYFLDTKRFADSVCVAQVGYATQVCRVKTNAYQVINFELSPNQVQLNDVVVRPGENQANVIMRKVIARKDKNNPANVPMYRYESYNKMQFDINNFDRKLKNKRMFKQLQFVFNYIDTSAISGKTYLPFMIIESLSDVYHQSNPTLNREVVKANKISGVENQSFAQFTGVLALDFDIYNNYINVFNQGLVSPIADQGFFYYKYYLIDSMFIDNNWCYQLSFKPKRKQEPTFTGFMWIADTSFAVKRTQLKVADDINVNYLKDVVATNEFIQLKDSIWMPFSQSVFADINLSDKATGFFGRKTTTFRNFRIGDTIPENIRNANQSVQVDDDVMKKTDAFWDSARHVPLSMKEKQIYTMVDSVKKLPIFRSVVDIVNLFFGYYYNAGKFDIGPYYTLYSYNPVEGHRFRIGGRTSKTFSKRIRLEGYVAYGTRDKHVKYGAGVLYIVKKNPRIAIGANFENDIRQLGKSDNFLMDDNILWTVLRRRPNNKLSFVYERKAYIERDWYQGLSNTLTVRYREIFSGPHVPFFANNPQNAGQPLYIGSIVASEFSLNTRYAADDKYITGDFRRVRVGRKSPVFNITYTQGVKGALKGEYNYQKIKADVTAKIPINPLGFMKVKFDAGKIFGALPYPLLELHKGNETYAFDYYAFNMMNYYEFVSDQFVSGFAEQHFQGLFFNHLPLLRKLKLREVATIRGVIGSVSDKHREVMLFPRGLTDVGTPYFESSLGVENILKIVRIDAMWRLNHLDEPHVQRFGIRAMLEIIF